MSRISILENQSNDEIENDIYYHRELLTNSVEGRRVDLLTITSFHNIQKEQEYRFPELFPDTNSKRCALFKNKKVKKKKTKSSENMVHNESYILDHFHIITSSSW